MDYYNDELGFINNLNKIVVYGAGTMGRALKLCLESGTYRKRVNFFLVRDEDDNPVDIDGCQVVRLSQYKGPKNIPIIVALNEKNMISACNGLKEKGFSNLIRLNAAGDTWQYIKGNYFVETKNLYLPIVPIVGKQKKGQNSLIEKTKFHDLLKVYVVKSIYDKRISEKRIMGKFEQEIQVGAALTDKSICNIKDDAGENISAYNKKYCELTALYWLWKHETSDYVGLSHYRRRFDMSPGEVSCIRDLAIDVVLTIPVIVTRGIRNQYALDHGDDDWDIMLDELHRLHPEYDESISYVQEQQYFFAYNMFIMRRTVLDGYCKWLFPILFACVERIGEKDDGYQNRYAGFLAERLLNVYLYHNREKLKIAVAKRHYLE